MTTTTTHADPHPYGPAFIEAVMTEITNEHHKRSDAHRWPSPVGYTCLQGKPTVTGTRLGCDPAEPGRLLTRPTVDKGYGPQELFLTEAINHAVKRLHEAGRVRFLRRFGYVWLIASGQKTIARDGDEECATPGADGPHDWDRL